MHPRMQLQLSVTLCLRMCSRDVQVRAVLAHEGICAVAEGWCAQAGAPDDKPTRRGNVLWRSFWGAHQRFFRHLCMAAKVPGLVRMSNVRPWATTTLKHTAGAISAVAVSRHQHAGVGRLSNLSCQG